MISSFKKIPPLDLNLKKKKIQIFDKILSFLLDKLNFLKANSPQPMDSLLRNHQ